MGRLKGSSNKRANKATKATKAAGKEKRIPPPPSATAKKMSKAPAPGASRKERPHKMSDELDDLYLQVAKLEEENQALKEKNEQLESDLIEAHSTAAAPDTAAKKKWIRGKLPGEKLIKTDNETGAFQEISREEWNALA